MPRTAPRTAAPAMTAPVGPVGRWLIDAARSTLQVSVTVGMVATVRGRFAQMSGSVDIALDPTASSVSVNVGTSSLTSGSGAMDALLHQAGIVDSARNPAIAFASRDIRPAAKAGRWLLDGLLATDGGILDITLQMPRPVLAADGTLQVSARGQLSTKDAVRLLSRPGVDRLLGRTMGLDLTVVAHAA